MARGLTTGHEAPKCRCCGKPLKPRYRTIYRTTEATALPYDRKMPKIGDLVYGTYGEAIVAFQELKVPDGSTYKKFKVWAGEWGRGQKFCNTNCAIDWAVKHA